MGRETCGCQGQSHGQTLCLLHPGSETKNLRSQLATWQSRDREEWLRERNGKRLRDSLRKR